LAKILKSCFIFSSLVFAFSFVIFTFFFEKFPNNVYREVCGYAGFPIFAFFNRRAGFPPRSRKNGPSVVVLARIFAEGTALTDLDFAVVIPRNRMPLD
jgi:hypothetical protein